MTVNVWSYLIQSGDHRQQYGWIYKRVCTNYYNRRNNEYPPYSQIRYKNRHIEYLAIARTEHMKTMKNMHVIQAQNEMNKKLYEEREKT
jgi:hypothetical protein